MAIKNTVDSVKYPAIKPYLETITATLKMILQLKGKYRDIEDVNAALKCISAVAKVASAGFYSCILQLLPMMITNELWPELIEALKAVAEYIPGALLFIEDSLMNIVSSTLTLPYSPSGKSVNEDEERNSAIILAFDALGAFDFTCTKQLKLSF